jgi:NAD-dependent deacetylase sirtuin 5
MDEHEPNKGPHDDTRCPWEAFAAYMTSCRRILCVIGAGLSAPSGISTWRGAGDMLNGIEVRELASPYKFKQDLVLVWSFYGERMLEALTASMAH